MTNLVVWDFNGVVVDDTEAHRVAFNDVLRTLFNRAGYATLDETRLATTVPYVHSFEKMGITNDELSSRVADVDRLYHETYLSDASAYALRRGVNETLQAVREGGGVNVILSNTRRDILDVQLARLGIAAQFTWISTSDQRNETGFRLNKTARLRTCPQLASASQACIIGDSTEETDVARTLGIKSIVVEGGWFDAERLRACNADIQLTCTSALPTALRRLNILT